MKKVLFAFAICILSPAASAQTTTNCNVFGSTLSCQTNPNRVEPNDYSIKAPDPSAGFAQGWQMGNAIRQQREAVQAEQRKIELERNLQNERNIELQRATQNRQVRENVGSLLASGQCDEAMRHALRAGELAIAIEAKNFCGQTESQKPSAPKSETLRIVPLGQEFNPH